MKRKFLLITTIIFALSVGIISYFIIFSSWNNLDIKTKGAEIIEKEEKEIENTYSNTDSDYEGSQKDPVDLVQFMFSAVYYEKPFFFSSAFLADQFLEDLTKVSKQTGKEITGEEGEMYLIHKISRNGKLNEVVYLSSDKNNFNATAKVKVKLLYSDGKNIRLTLKMKKINSGKNKENWAITTSTWDIIKKVNS